MTTFNPNSDFNLVKIVYLVFVLSIIVLVYKVAHSIVDSSTAKIEQDFAGRDAIIRKAVFGKKSKYAQIGKLKEQYAITDEIKKSYFYMAQKFNSYHFTFNVVFTFCSIISAMLAFLVVKKGWDNIENFYLKSSFLIFFFSTSLFGLLPNVLNNKENSKNNLAKYNYYNGLQLDIYNLVKDNKRYIRNNHLDSLDLQISAINAHIKDNQDLYFDMKTENVNQEIKPSF